MTSLGLVSVKLLAFLHRERASVTAAGEVDQMSQEHAKSPRPHISGNSLLLRTYRRGHVKCKRLQSDRRESPIEGDGTANGKQLKEKFQRILRVLM